MQDGVLCYDKSDILNRHNERNKMYNSGARLKIEIFNLRIWAYSHMGRAHAGKAWV